MLQTDLQTELYNKEDLLNPPFIAFKMLHINYLEKGKEETILSTMLHSVPLLFFEPGCMLLFFIVLYCSDNVYSPVENQLY